MCAVVAVMTAVRSRASNGTPLRPFLPVSFVQAAGESHDRFPHSDRGEVLTGPVCQGKLVLTQRPLRGVSMYQPGACLEVVSSEGPIREPVTKVGGQPVWLEEPQWPLSRATGEPMQFLGQFTLDGGRLAYLFVRGEDFSGETAYAEGGENAVIIQPGGRVPDFVSVRAQAKGPAACVDHRLRLAEAKTCVFLGGPGVEPNWIHEERYPGVGWKLVIQLTSELEDWLPLDGLTEEGIVTEDLVPCYQAWGQSGWGACWIFVSPDGKEGRFLWDCV